MKTVLILRHAKASRDNPALPDHDRPLTERGKQDAVRMGELLAKQGVRLDLIVTSTAKRARKTAERIARTIGYDGEVREIDKLYVNTPAVCVEVLRELPEACQSVMLVGHNPSFEELLEILTGEAREMPTAALAKVALDIAAWGELDGSPKGRIDGFWTPHGFGD